MSIKKRCAMSETGNSLNSPNKFVAIEIQVKNCQSVSFDVLSTFMCDVMDVIYLCKFFGKSRLEEKEEEERDNGRSSFKGINNKS